MDLEKIKEACAINYNFTIKNWSTTEPLRDPVEDVKLLIAEVEQQAEEIGRLEVDRDLAEYDKEKAEAEVKRWKQSYGNATSRLKAENQRLIERIEFLETSLSEKEGYVSEQVLEIERLIEQRDKLQERVRDAEGICKLLDDAEKNNLVTLLEAAVDNARLFLQHKEGE